MAKKKAKATKKKAYGCKKTKAKKKKK